MVQTIVPKDFSQYCSSPQLCTMISYGYTLSLGRIFCLLIVHRRSTFGVNILEVSYILYIKQHLYKLQLQQIKLHIEIVNLKPVTPTTILLPVPTFDPRCGAYPWALLGFVYRADSEPARALHRTRRAHRAIPLVFTVSVCFTM